MSTAPICPLCNHELATLDEGGFLCVAIGCELRMPNRTHESLEKALYSRGEDLAARTAECEAVACGAVCSGCNVGAPWEPAPWGGDFRIHTSAATGKKMTCQATNIRRAFLARWGAKG